MPSASVQKLAKRLMAIEARGEPAPQLREHEAQRVCEKLQFALTQFAGRNAFHSLLQRALVLARTEVPAMQTVQLRRDGTLEGLDELLTEASEHGSAAAVLIIANLLELLVTFIGEPLMLRIVKHAWPDEILGDTL
jgi:hypothetical protein